MNIVFKDVVIYDTDVCWMPQNYILFGLNSKFLICIIEHIIKFYSNLWYGSRLPIDQFTIPQADP